MMTMRHFLDSVYLHKKMDLKAATVESYRGSLNLMDRWKGKCVRTLELSDDLLRSFMRWLIAEGRSPATVNSKRRAVLAMWRFAFREGLSKIAPSATPRLKEPERLAQGWTVEQLTVLLNATNAAPVLDGWNQDHWRALILTLYDTGLRIGAAVQIPSVDLSQQGFLICRAEFQKQSSDTVHKLHSQTMDAIHRLPKHKLLFPWPLAKRSMYRHYRKLLKAADLPSGRRDLFHRLRRTSYTYVYRELGLQAATEHADHSCDLSHIYLDKTLLNKPFAVDVLPRPKL